ncbi:hypothetical protein PP175_06180 [Aneurinibacillus sp. Ricciae_BoGa-3]|nr:hypothetical protein [Aneurinibacillus sp. Ricciae_BoGa-3]WCK55534.1 hypothetical protein PP175_06180 [Aneurinibacillus sp. Ricciae_BoGa-3]
MTNKFTVPILDTILKFKSDEKDAIESNRFAREESLGLQAF